MGNKPFPETKADRALARHFIVSFYKSRPKTPWKMEVKASFAGKRIRKFCRTEAEAYSVGFDIVRKIQGGGTESLQRPEGMGMAVACKAFLAENNPDTCSKSHSDKCAQIAGMLQARFSHLQVSRTELVEWFATLKGSETTRSMYFRYLRQFFSFCRRLGFVSENPTEAIKPPKAAIARNFLQPDEMKRVLALPMPDWLKAFICLSGFTGLRTVELMALKYEDIDTDAEEIHVQLEKELTADNWFDERIVEFTEPLKRRKKLLKGKGNIVPVSARNLHYAMEDLAQALGWPEWPFNCLRHSFATYHLATCKNAGVTAYLMGHTNPSMVQRVYAAPARKAKSEQWWAL